MKSLRKFVGAREGNVAVTFALTLLPVMGSVGAAVDYARASNEKARLQSLVDRAALAAVQPQGISDAERIALAKSFFPRSGNSSNSADPNHDERTVSVAVEGRTVTVTADQPVAAVMASLLNIDRVRVSARSKARTVATGQPVCVLALNTSTPGAVSFSGNTTFLADGCAIHANSRSGSAITSNGSISVQAWSFCAVGGVNASGVTATSPNQPNVRGNCFEQVDPFRHLRTPTPETCRQNNTNVSVQPNRSDRLRPGTYCGTLDLKGTVTLDPGTYIIQNGTLSISSQANVTGNGVTFILAGTSTFDINGGGTVSLTAPATGDFRNMLIVQERPSVPPVGGATTGTNKLNGNSSTSVQGVIYTPTQIIAVTGTGGFGSTGTFMPLVASVISFSGNSTTRADVENNPTPSPLPLSDIGATLVN